MREVCRRLDIPAMDVSYIVDLFPLFLVVIYENRKITRCFVLTSTITRSCRAFEFELSPFTVIYDDKSFRIEYSIIRAANIPLIISISLRLTL